MLEERLAWDGPVLRVGDVAFDTSIRAQYPDSERLDLYKGPGVLRDLLATVDQLDRPVRHIFEIGIHHGGSTALWNELLAPERLTAIDLSKDVRNAALARYLETRGDAIRLHWRTDQADRRQLRAIVDEDGVAPIDLVIDDGSHLLEPTTAAFETLFPLVRPGGWYVIEDWCWEYWLKSPDDDRTLEQSSLPLIQALAPAVAARRDVVASIVVQRGAVGICRGEAATEELALANLTPPRVRPSARVRLRRTRKRLRPRARLRELRRRLRG
jgi:hypothetical protein